MRAIYQRVAHGRRHSCARDGRFGARSNSLALPRNRAGRARPRRPPEYPQVLIAPIWRAFAAFLQSDVFKFAYFVERADPFDVRFTLPVVMCTYVTSTQPLLLDREAFTRTFGRAVTNEAVGFFRDHSPFFADGSNQLYLSTIAIAELMVDGSKEQLKFLMMGAQDGCGVCARVVIFHLEREDPVREDPRPFFGNFSPEARAAPQATRRRSRSCRPYCRGPGPPRRRPSSRTWKS